MGLNLKWGAPIRTGFWGLGQKGKSFRPSQILFWEKFFGPSPGGVFWGQDKGGPGNFLGAGALFTH